MDMNGIKNWIPMHKKTKSKYFVLFLFFVFLKSGYSQNFDFGFQRNDSIIVLKFDETTYKDPWAGGLNNCQFFELDLDLNGINDLIVFDKHGNKMLPFLRFNDCGHTGYFFAPEYTDLLPKCSSWVNSVDYNLDGKKDLFTYTLGGVRVFKNTSDLDFQLHLAKSRLTSDYGSSVPINLFTSEADYPGFADINGDESVDVVNFWALGKYVEYHENTSVPVFETYDSLTFRLNASCWGHFEENESSNVLQLNSNCGNKNTVLDNYRHSGSTMLIIDLNGDGIKDLVIGDVDYPQLISLTNGGTLDTAKMISQDTMFPCVSKPVRLFSMPAANSIDVDFDDVPDLLVSPFDPARDKSENQHSIWLYKNIGSRIFPQFEFVTDQFLQDRMIDLGSGAYPTFSDVNSDGLLDLVVGNWGVYDSSNYVGSFLHSYYSASLSLFLNIGTPSRPMFKLADTNFAHMREYSHKGFFPALSDLDGDGDVDMLVGNETGKLLYLQNDAGINQLPIFGLPIDNYQNILVHSYAAPQLFDLDKDGKVDLLIGDSLGKIHYYKNTGTTTNPIFSLITDTLGGVNVRNSNVSYYGFSTPCFFLKNDTTFLAVGSESGFVYMYKNIDHNLSGTFELIEDSIFFIRKSQKVPIYEGVRSAVAIADINQDQYPDLMLGNFSGGLTYFKGTTPPPLTIDVAENPSLSAPLLNVFPNPCNEQINFSFLNQDYTSSEKNIIIYNSLMKEVQTIKTTDDFISVLNLHPGFYILKITLNKNKCFFSKFIKK